MAILLVKRTSAFAPTVLPSRAKSVLSMVRKSAELAQATTGSTMTPKLAMRTNVVAPTEMPSLMAIAVTTRLTSVCLALQDFTSSASPASRTRTLTASLITKMFALAALEIIICKEMLALPTSVLAMEVLPLVMISASATDKTNALAVTKASTWMVPPAQLMFAHVKMDLYRQFVPFTIMKNVLAVMQVTT